MNKKKIIIYQTLPRLFGNRNLTRKVNGTLAENGCGKLSDFDAPTLRRIHTLGVTHIWYTGVVRHATATDYSRYGIPRQHPVVVKGRAGSPYAITDYYDIDPDLADDVEQRMDEWSELVDRTHAAGMRVIIDFVPNHVARQYHSIVKPADARDLGEDDDAGKRFDLQNNFYYCTGEPFAPQFDLKCGAAEPYVEMPAKATGNDRFDSHPGINDWYETVKLNYGIDYCDAGGRSEHFDPVPNTWIKMTDILLFWAAKGVDGFRCDMVEMVPTAFWAYATQIVKERFPGLLFIGEVYDPEQYRSYIDSGFDYLYDKVGMYDCVRAVIRGERPASSITYQWQVVGDMTDRMLYFLENHDEQRVASDYFCGEGRKALPGLIVSALMQTNPFMLYAGQEYGERGMDREGFSGTDGRTTIFDYWAVDAIYKGYFKRAALTAEQKYLALRYQQILRIANREKAVREGRFFDLMYVNPQSWQFNPYSQFAFLRKCDDDVLLVIVNFSGQRVLLNVNIPGHAFDYLGMSEREVVATDLLTGESCLFSLKRDGTLPADIRPYGGRIYKFSMKMEKNGYVLNEHNKEEFPPAHTAEHLLNQVMVQMFGCERSRNAHIERKKSKVSYILERKPDRKQEKAIETRMNELIAEDLPVTYEYVDRNHIPADVKLDRLPDDASETIRLVRIGHFDVCPCIGKHVRSTSQIGRFELLGTNWDESTHSFRIRFKVVAS
ncbi:alpha-amylase family glycosyl hydrolase [Hoylesella pleuritidis]|uniref:Alpha amylase, catalytic domain protein n=1 Tax=Hoylesella pleuritidis F0068 TaxID=1081904 RepID=U2KK31_9BACT|nr:alpha-amylase family glycosyl hydrolase [Hoylesella pleuritidis]ERJ98846.1 alpha amylase, catalytic domain protein [Hoylesella pleuritidis F0068]